MQSTLTQTLLQNASAASDAAKPAVIAAIEAIRSTLLHPYDTMMSEDLLEMLAWEFKRLPVYHNGPLDATEASAAGITDDTTLLTTLRNGYMQNMCHRVAFGAPDEVEAIRLHTDVMVKYFGLPPFANPDYPTVREANDCFIYNSDAIDKRAAGYFIYGAVTYVLQPRGPLVIVAADSGAHPEVLADFGTLEHFYHLVLPHIAAIGDNLPYLFERWWVPGTPAQTFGGAFPYFELEWFGSVWLPEDLLYTTVKFAASGTASGVFGTDLGKALQSFMRASGRPLLWASHPILIRHGPSPLLCCCCCGVFACCLLTPHPTHLQADGDDSGAIIDPVVNRVANSKITAQDAKDFQGRYDQRESNPHSPDQETDTSHLAEGTTTRTRGPSRSCTACRQRT